MSQRNGVGDLPHPQLWIGSSVIRYPESPALAAADSASASLPR